MIDEIQILNEERGATLEAVITRMKSLSQRGKLPIRMMAVSATCPNISDIAAWLAVDPDATKCFGEEYRPVKLVRKQCLPMLHCTEVNDVTQRTVVRGVPSSKNKFFFYKNLVYKSFDAILAYNNQRPTLVV